MGIRSGKCDIHTSDPSLHQEELSKPRSAKLCYNLWREGMAHSSGNSGLLKKKELEYILSLKAIEMGSWRKRRGKHCLSTFNMTLHVPWLHSLMV